MTPEKTFKCLVEGEAGKKLAGVAKDHDEA